MMLFGATLSKSKQYVWLQVLDKEGRLLREVGPRFVRDFQVPRRKKFKKDKECSWIFEYDESSGDFVDVYYQGQSIGIPESWEEAEYEKFCVFSSPLSKAWDSALEFARIYALIDDRMPTSFAFSLN